MRLSLCLLVDGVGSATRMRGSPTSVRTDPVFNDTSRIYMWDHYMCIAGQRIASSGTVVYCLVWNCGVLPGRSWPIPPSSSTLSSEHQS